MSLNPLKNPLEARPTVYRVIRYLGIILDQNQIGQVGKLIRDGFNGETNKVAQWENGRRFWVAVYPADYIPEMIRIIKEYKSANRVKRKRISK